MFCAVMEGITPQGPRGGPDPVKEGFQTLLENGGQAPGRGTREPRSRAPGGMDAVIDYLQTARPIVLSIFLLLSPQLVTEHLPCAMPCPRNRAVLETLSRSWCLVGEVGSKGREMNM